MQLIAAVDSNWAIGNKNQLLVQIPLDQKMFRQETFGKVVVMGRKTFESLPGQVALDGRTNIVLTKNPQYKARGAIVVHSLEELDKELQNFDTNQVYVIGGAMVYEELLERCTVAHITKIDYCYQADAYLTNLDESPDWQCTAESDEQTYFDLEYYFYRYERVKK